MSPGVNLDYLGTADDDSNALHYLLCLILCFPYVF